MSETLVQIKLRTLQLRINRKLAKQGQKLYATQGMYARHQLGDWHIVTLDQQKVIQRHCDVVQVGRALGVLRRWEGVMEEEKV